MNTRLELILRNTANFLGLLSLASKKSETPDTYARNDRSVITKLNRQVPILIENKVDVWMQAWHQAKSRLNPVRSTLYRLYDQAMLDLHIGSQIETRIIKTIGQPFVLVHRTNKTISEDHTELLKRPWFTQLTRHFVESIFWGHSLVELVAKTKNSRSKLVDSEFMSCDLIPREHVKPETGQLVVNPFDQDGLAFREEPFNRQLIEMGRPDDLGLLSSISLEFIYKNFSKTDWARHAEKFGFPMIAYVPSPGTTQAELEEIDKQLANMGQNMYALLQPGSNPPVLLGDQKSNPHEMYLQRMVYADNQISKRVVGQTMTADNGSSRSQAEVHERMLDEFIEADMRAFQDYINWILIPFLMSHGYPLEDYDFVFKRFLNDYLNPGRIPSPEENAPSSDNTQQGGQAAVAPKAKAQKPKPNFKLASTAGSSADALSAALSALYEHTCHDGCDQSDLQLATSEPVFKINQARLTYKWLKEFHQAEGRLGIPDKFTEDTYKLLVKALRAGYGEARLQLATQPEIPQDTDWSFTDQRILNALEDNIWSFSQAKSESLLKEITSKLTVDGRIVEWSAFRKSVAGIIENYNRNYLRAEYNYTQAAGQMAAKWHDIQARAEFFPNLVYRTANDDLVRPEHRQWEGITKPVNDSWWNWHYPPNGWNCRCTVINTVAKATEGTPPAGEIPPLFRNNVGKSLKVFNEAHPYFSA